MLRKIIERPVSVLMFYAGIVVLGLISLKRLDMALFPQIDYPVLSVMVDVEPSNPLYIEKNITDIMEEELKTVSGIVDIYSYTGNNFANIVLRFRWGENMDIAFINVKEKILNIQDKLPQEVKNIRILTIGPNTKPFMGILFPSNQKEVVLEDVSLRLGTIKGVSKIEISGVGKEFYVYKINPLDILNRRASLHQIENKIKRGLLKSAGGYVIINKKQYPLIIEPEIKRVEELKDIIKGGAIEIHQERKNRIIYSKGEYILLFIYPSYGLSPVKISAEVRKILKRYKDLDYKIFFDKSKFIKDSVLSLGIALLTGIFLSFLIIFIFLKDYKPAIAIGSSLIISLTSAFFFFYIFKLNLNIITLGGLVLAVGLLVDSAIIIVESIAEEKEKIKETEEAVIKGTKKVKNAIFASILTNCVVFLPSIYIHGFGGRISRPLAITVVITLLISLFVSFTLVPVILSNLRKTQYEYPIWLKKFLQFLEKFEWFIIKRYKRTLILQMFLVVLGLSLFPFLKVESFPFVNTGKIKIHILPAPEIKDEEMLSLLENIGKRYGDFLIYENKKGIRYYDLYLFNVKNYNEIKNIFKNLPSRFIFTIHEFDNPGEDFRFKETYASPFKKEKIIKIIVNSRKILNSGITPDKLMDILTKITKPVEVGVINGKQIYLSPDVKNIDEILNFPIRKDGKIFKLGYFLDISKDSTLSLILHQQGKRVSNISPGLETQKVKKSILLSGIFAIILVYMVIASQYESLKIPFIVFFSIPFSFVFIPLVLLITGNSLNSISFLGIIILTGISVNDAIILIDYIQKARSEIKDLNLSIIEGIIRRTRPILMTTLTTIFALIPLAFGIGPGANIEKSMAIVIIFGLISSTLSTYTITPCLYKLLTKK